MGEHSSEADRLLTESECVKLAEQVFGFQQGGGDTLLRVVSYWGADLRWGRNRVTLGGDRRETTVEIWRRLNLASGKVTTNQLDAIGLAAAVRKAEHLMRNGKLGVANNALRAPYLFKPEYPSPAIWSDATYALTPEERGRIARAVMEPAEDKGMLSAGHLAAEAQAHAVMTTMGHRLYARLSQARCSVTVRDQQGTGSGWAGKTSYDWAKIDGSTLAQRALDKCFASRNPVALEPGRYTVVLESQAVADLLEMLVRLSALDRERNEEDEQTAPFWLRPGVSKLGLKVADERVTIGQDPLDPNLGARPFSGFDSGWSEEMGGELGDPYRAVNWIDKGMLTVLAHSRGYGLSKLHENVPRFFTGAFRMSGGDASVDQMIANTKRGLLVTRFWGIGLLDRVSLLSTGLTRDGLWLIENGKVTKPVKNFRFVESPLFVLNQIEQLGRPEPVFRPGERADLRPAIAPPLKARDFSFTALADAV